MTLIRGALTWSPGWPSPVATDVAIEGGRIARVGERLTPAAGEAVIDGTGKLLLPGFVNAHTHAQSHFAKGAIDGLPLELWLPYLGARVGMLKPQDLYVSTALGAIEMLKTGTTCACDMAQMPGLTDEAIDAVVRAYRDVGMRVALAAQVSDVPPWRSFEGLEEHLSQDVRNGMAAQPPASAPTVLAALRRAVERHHDSAEGRIRFGVGPSTPTSCTDELLVGVADLARELDLTVQTHVAETRAGAYTARVRYGASAVVKLDQLGLLGPRTLLAHSVWIDDRDMELVAARGATIAHNPVSNLKLGSGIAPLIKMREHGCHVGLGTDGSTSSDNQNLIGVMRLAAILPRVVDQRHENWPTAADVLTMAISGGARGAGFESIGAIAPGQLADLILVDLGPTYYHPRNDLIAQLVHADVGASVVTVIVNGEVVVRDGRVTRVDQDKLLAEADALGRRIADAVAPGLAGQIAAGAREALEAISRTPLMREVSALGPFRTG
jgi:guanine deaminase